MNIDLALKTALTMCLTSSDNLLQALEGRKEGRQIVDDRYNRQRHRRFHPHPCKEMNDAGSDQLAFFHMILHDLQT